MEPMGIEALIALGAWYERYKNYRKDMPTLQHVFSTVEAATGHMEPAAPQVAIYALIDPRTLAIRYIGISGDPLARLQAYVQDKANGFKHEWLDELRQDGLVPIMRILEIVPSTADSLEREKRWIEACVSAGLDILNAASLPKREITQIAQRVEAVRGELSHTSKVTPAQRTEIVRLHQAGEKPSVIAGAVLGDNHQGFIVRSVLQEEETA